MRFRKDWRSITLAFTVLGSLGWVMIFPSDTCDPERHRDTIGLLICGAVLSLSGMIAAEYVWDVGERLYDRLIRAR